MLDRPDPDKATLKGVAAWNPMSGQPGIVTKADDELKQALRETFADTAARDVIDRLWPPQEPLAGLADLDTAITVLKAVLEPETLLPKMINAAARVAALHAGFGPVAQLVGQFAEDLCKQFLRPPLSSDRITVDVLHCIDIDLYAAADDLPGCATLREVTVEDTSLGIEELLKGLFRVEPLRSDHGGRNKPT